MATGVAVVVGVGQAMATAGQAAAAAEMVAAAEAAAAVGLAEGEERTGMAVEQRRKNWTSEAERRVAVLGDSVASAAEAQANLVRPTEAMAAAKEVLPAATKSRLRC